MLARINKLFVVAMFALLMIQPSLPWEKATIDFGVSTVAAQGIQVDAEKSLLIRGLPVVEDPSRTFNPCTGVGTPMGKWTFGYLFSEMINQPVTGLDPSKVARSWLRSWAEDQVVNGNVLPARRSILQTILRPWQEASGGINQPPDLSKAPFRLLAIVNRVDLRNDQVLGGTGAGEARFVFGALDLTQNCQPLQFTLNFEYHISKTSCVDIQDWAMQWQNLTQFDFGSESYNSALEQITEQFVAAGSDPNQRPNQSALNVVVTNEIALATQWEMRAFQLVSSGRGRGTLQPTVTKQTPDDDLNRTSVIVDFINSNETSILARDYTVPLTFPNETPFLGGNPQMVGNTFWDAPNSGPAINSSEARHIFSLNTCNGCHSRETANVFTHVRPTPFGVPANLSGFMTGIDVVDPGDRVTVRHFNELARRSGDLELLLTTSCSE